MIFKMERNKKAVARWPDNEVQALLSLILIYYVINVIFILLNTINIIPHLFIL